MLCDTMLGKWIDKSMQPKFEPVVERLLEMAQEGASEEELSDFPVSKARRIEVRDAFARWLESGPYLSDHSPVKMPSVAAFQGKLIASKKFFISPEFVRTSLKDFATPETMVKAKEWFRLTHNPMWLEWQFADLPGLRTGVTFYSDEGIGACWCYVVTGIKDFQDTKFNAFNIRHYRIFPETADMRDGKFYMRMEEDGKEVADEDGAEQFAIFAYDCIIRINSPRITEFRPCDDLDKINRKREKQGKSHLVSYVVVDLSREIKQSLRQSGSEGGGVRFHWRRGHFKARKNGLFWWNPHTAGRKVLGEIEKDYAA